MSENGYPPTRPPLQRGATTPAYLRPSMGSHVPTLSELSEIKIELDNATAALVANDRYAQWSGNPQSGSEQGQLPPLNTSLQRNSCSSFIFPQFSTMLTSRLAVPYQQRSPPNSPTTSTQNYRYPTPPHSPQDQPPPPIPSHSYYASAIRHTSSMAPPHPIQPPTITYPPPRSLFRFNNSNSQGPSPPVREHVRMEVEASPSHYILRAPIGPAFQSGLSFYSSTLGSFSLTIQSRLQIVLLSHRKRGMLS
jgi:hypothetical protein